MGKVIVIDDNVVYCDYVGNLLAKEGIAIEKIYSFRAAKKALAAVRSDDIVLSDLRFPDGDGIELLRIIRYTGHNNPFFIMTDYDEVPTAVRSMKSGADDYISKRKLEDELLPVIRNLLKRKRRANTNGENIFQRESEAFQFIDRRIRLVASTNISVLILGENGTGKEHIAEKIHRLSDRANKRLVAVDCGLLSASLAASTLFGHEKGAFTGATDNKAGYFREADGGTLFLDEVGNLPMEVQQMLLRAIQSKTYRSVGGSQDKVADVRIIAATNEDLKKAVEEKRFRQDLYYRIQEFVIDLPPLRKCREDILPLAKFFIDEMNTELNKSVSGLDTEVTERLQLYNWPGNVRELRQTIQTAVLMTGSGMITAETLGLPEEVVYANSDFSLIDDEIQKERIIKALKQADGNKRQAARLLGISPPTLYKKLEQYHIQ
ncbi:sigma-54-dependent transcriptional regulator [Parabacteroides chinchillae]|uniref:Two-component system, NtrC family, response regulator HydG n=1 Tax=Parabacteroides chinchillae TaxID=871327 RepID=A0A8G2BWZ7_9BACT|nr:sigma-54 dependent transcriptional regulator [Parabacteroides chinchillae]SEF96299.1 two-component system, NtrC family, response regulator HydG [Parabacteroides chinchillae]